MSSSSLKSHAEALYSISLRPSISTARWVVINAAIRNLGSCLQSYSSYLDTQLELQTKRQKLDHPVRTVSENVTVEHRTAAAFEVGKNYLLLDTAVLLSGLLKPVFFDESQHIQTTFTSTMQRHRFLECLQLSIPIDVFKYAPGGSHTTVVIIVQVTENRTEEEMLTETARVMSEVEPMLPVFHTRLMRKVFKQKFENVASLSPSIVEFIYKELALDSSVAEHSETQQRLRLIFLGEEGLLPDLRKLNPGRPTGAFDVFWQQLETVIEQVTAADERRHNVAHLSEWISLKDLIQRAKDQCPEGTPIPSSALVRLQFTPRNPYTHAALNFTSRYQVQYKIQRRQLRAQHVDDHYCAALLKYMKCLSVTLGAQCIFLSCDDKAKIPLGEPGLPLSTGVRGKKTLAPVNTTISALDHDVHHKGSLTPSVYLKVDVPTDVTKSFCRGEVTVTLNDSIFQASGPFRHAVALEQQLGELNSIPKILLKFSDGGTDQRNTLESVKCSLIYLFKKLDLDMVIAARCAPGQSWTNMAEREMSILNLGLQNCALERDIASEEIEAHLKKCGNMNEIRELQHTVPQLKEAWQKSIQSSKDIIEIRFERLSVKGKPIRVKQPVDVAKIRDAKQYVENLFPGLDASVITKKSTKGVASYHKWLGEHCRIRNYSFQIKKCETISCCTPTVNRQERLVWLPDPILDESGEHYKPFASVYGTDTMEDDRPSLQDKTAKAAKKKCDRAGKNTFGGGPTTAPAKPKNTKNKPVALPVKENMQGDASIFTAQNAQAVFECVECKKPRVVYSKNKLTERQQAQLVTIMTEYEYSCGAPVTPPNHPLHSKVFMRLGICCESRVENPYYSSDIGQKDLCCMCGSEKGLVDLELKKQYKTVLPVCESCTAAGHEQPCLRPYGKANSGK